jgi:hypothetical protein
MSFLDDLLASSRTDSAANIRADAIDAHGRAAAGVDDARRHLAAIIAEHGYGRRSDAAAAVMAHRERVLADHPHPDA